MSLKLILTKLLELKLQWVEMEQCNFQEKQNIIYSLSFIIFVIANSNCQF